MRFDISRVAVVIIWLTSVAWLLLTTKPRPFTSSVTKEANSQLQGIFGFSSALQREELLYQTEAKFKKLYEIGLAVIELDEKKVDIVTKKNILGFKVTAVMEVKWKSLYKFGIDLEQGWDIQFQDEKLIVMAPRIELLSAQPLGPLRGEIIDKGLGINEKERLKQLTETIPEVIQERGEKMSRQREIELLVAHEFETHLRQIFASKNIMVGEISISFRH